ncbi:transposase [Marinobacter segnicrescens]|uniref:transposase n=1 Tax=Marinobacter segnicrescens TaxID=430453 RepID=UPI003A92D5AB
MKQMTFADAEYAGKRKQTRKELFLIEMDQVVPWKGLIALIEPHQPKGEGGRPAYPLMAMLRVHLMQNCSVMRRIERAKAQTRSKVEHPFRVLKRQFGYSKVRFRGLVKNTAQMVTLFALSNLWMARRHLLSSAGEVRL